MAKHIFTTASDTLSYNNVPILATYKIAPYSTERSVTIYNARDVKDTLIRFAKIEDIEVNGKSFTTVKDLSAELTPLLFLDGGAGSGSGATKKFYLKYEDKAESFPQVLTEPKTYPDIIGTDSVQDIPQSEAVNLGYVRKSDGVIIASSQTYHSDFISLPAGAYKAEISGYLDSNSGCTIAFYDENKVFISAPPGVPNWGEQQTVNIPSQAVFIRVAYTTAALYSYFCKIQYKSLGFTLPDNSVAFTDEKNIVVRVITEGSSQDLQETSKKGNYTNQGLRIIDKDNPNNIITIKDGKISLQLQTGKEGDPVIIKKTLDITNDTIDIKQKYNESPETSAFKIDPDGMILNLSTFDFNGKLILDSLQNDVEFKDPNFRKAWLDALAISLEEIMVNGSSTTFSMLFQNMAGIDLENPLTGGNTVSIKTKMESSNPYSFGGSVTVSNDKGYSTTLNADEINYLTPNNAKLNILTLPEKDGQIALLSDIIDPKAPVTSEFLYSKKYYSTYFSKAFQKNNDLIFLKIQNTKPGNVHNLEIKGRIVVFEAYQEFTVAVKLDHQAFGSCWLKSSKSEDLIEELGFYYYNQGQVIFWLRGTINYSSQYTHIIIDQIRAFEPSTALTWKDEPITEVTDFDDNLVEEYITALIIQ